MTGRRPTIPRLLLSGLVLLGATASAQPTLRLYGTLDAAWAHLRNGDGAARSAIVSGQASTSRFGLRGQEELGAGLQAAFQLEAGFDADTGRGSGPGGSLAWNRQSWVGLGGPWGRVSLGRQYRPEARVAIELDPFDGGSFASPPNTYSGTVFRAGDALVYESPRAAGWLARVMLVPGERAGGLDDRGQALHYEAGPLRLAWGRDVRRNAAASDRRRWTSVGAGWQAGPLTLLAARRSRHEGAAGLDERSHWLGAVFEHGRLSLRASVGRARDRRAAQAEARAFSLGADYALSGRVALYARHARLRNRSGADFALGTAVDGSTPEALALGLRLRF